MILRELTVRHGRTVLASSAQCCKRTYASDITRLDRAFQPSTRDHVSTKTFTGHPDEPSSILDSSTLPPTADTRKAAQSVSTLMQNIHSLQANVNAHRAATEPAGTSTKSNSRTSTSSPSSSPFPDLQSFWDARTSARAQSLTGSDLVNVYEPWAIINNPPTAEDLTLSTLLANQTHLGHATSLWNPANSSYIFGVRDGIHIISLEITLAYLRRAAKVVREVARRGGIILFVGTRKGAKNIVVNAAKLSEGYHIFDRWVPGCMTNGQQLLAGCDVKIVNKMDQKIQKYNRITALKKHPVLRPDLVICLNPLENEVCLHECGLFNIPTIGIIDTDANPTWVTYPIPANDDSTRSMAIIAGALARAGQEGQQLRKESVMNGRVTVDTRKAEKYIAALHELGAMEAEEGGQEEESGNNKKRQQTA